MARIKPQALLMQSKKKKAPNRISVTTIILCSFIVILTLFFLHATCRHWSLRSRLLTESVESGGDEVSQASGDSMISNPARYVILDTSKGSITLELFKDASSELVNQFINLCQKGHFKGINFHRVIKHYIIQAGNADNPGAIEDWTMSGKHHGQLDTSLKHEAFMLGSSKTKHDSTGFELFITTAPIPDLNEKLIIFGRVIKGEDVVQEIEEVDTDQHYRPKSPIRITDVTLKQNI